MIGAEISSGRFRGWSVDWLDGKDGCGGFPRGCRKRGKAVRSLGAGLLEASNRIRYCAARSLFGLAMPGEALNHGLLRTSCAVDYSSRLKSPFRAGYPCRLGLHRVGAASTVCMSDCKRDDCRLDKMNCDKASTWGRMQAFVCNVLGIGEEGSIDAARRPSCLHALPCSACRWERTSRMKNILSGHEAPAVGVSPQFQKLRFA
jgi:hypothetical protein